MLAFFPSGLGNGAAPLCPKNALFFEFAGDSVGAERRLITVVTGFNSQARYSMYRIYACPWVYELLERADVDMRFIVKTPSAPTSGNQGTVPG